MNRRKKAYGLTATDLNFMAAAGAVAQSNGLAMTGLITVQSGLTNEGRRDPCGYLRRRIVGPLGTWFGRRGLPWLGFWVREAFEGDGREHVHVALVVPLEHEADLREAVERWWPGGIGDFRRFGSSLELIGYLSKQHVEGAVEVNQAGLLPLRRQEYARDGAPVAPVLGRRLGASRTLMRLVRKAAANAHAIVEATRD
jgi:hypothetical protein